MTGNVNNSYCKSIEQYYEFILKYMTCKLDNSWCKSCTVFNMNSYWWNSKICFLKKCIFKSENELFILFGE